MSSGITVSIPIEVFGTAESLTPQGITEALTKAQSNTNEIERCKSTNRLLLAIIKEQGERLEKIVEGGLDPMTQAREVRKMIQDLKSFDIREDLK